MAVQVMNIALSHVTVTELTSRLLSKSPHMLFYKQSM